MGQERLNYLMSNDRIDKLDLKSILNDLVQDSVHMSNIFSNFNTYIVSLPCYHLQYNDENSSKIFNECNAY